MSTLFLKAEWLSTHSALYSKHMNLILGKNHRKSIKESDLLLSKPPDRCAHNFINQHSLKNIKKLQNVRKEQLITK